jgi:hypothetical protein
MRIPLLFICLFACFLSCSDSDDVGFLGDWQGSTSAIVDGNLTTSETTVVIAEIEDMNIECNLTANGTSYIFDTREVDGKLTFSNAPVKNLIGLPTQTSITGTAELIADTLLIFNHQVVTMDGSSIISTVDYNLEFKR